MAENIVGKLYGAPFLLGHEDQAAFKKYATTHDTRSFDILGNEGDNIFKEIKQTLAERISDFDKVENGCDHWHSIASSLKKATLSPFDDDEDKMQNFLKESNKNLAEIEDDILTFVTGTLDEAASSAYKKGNFREMAARYLVKQEGQRYTKANIEAALSKQANKIADVINKAMSGDEKIIKKVNSDELLKYFFANNGKDFSKGVVFGNRKSGPAGELSNKFTDAFVFAIINNKNIEKITAESINQIVEIVGGKGGKADLVFHYLEDFLIGISIKNYKKLRERALKRGNNTSSEAKEAITLQSTTTLDNFLNYIAEHIDPQLKPSFKNLDSASSYWVNLAYGYHYSDQITKKDKELREMVDNYLRAFAISFIVTGTREKNNDYDDYINFIDFLLSQKNNYPALFFQFSGLGIIPSYELVEACANYIDKLNRHAAEIKVGYYTSSPLQKVDKMGEDQDYIDNNTHEKKGTEYGNLIAKGGKKGGWKVRQSKLDYYGTLDNIRINRNVDQILTERFKAFTEDLQVQITLDIIRGNLYEIFNKYGVRKN